MRTLRSRLLERPEELLPAIRAAFSYALFNKHKLRKSEIAAILGVSPASVTQYLNSSRAANTYREMLRNAKVSKLLDSRVEDLAQRFKLKVPIDTSRELSELSIEVFRMLKGEPMSREEVTLKGDVLEMIAERVKLEELAAKRALDVASRTTDELLKSALRQIATDSLRHAEILTLVSKGAPPLASISDQDLALLEELARYESEAEEKDLDVLMKRFKTPTALALLTSIEYDEKKHRAMIDILLQLTRGP
ncbi:MAG: hypothetical protein NZ920_00495 [Aigarchaeota archaeon]|nr:hypothetical protein [Aigarchaeota archaeon]MDW8092921.1 hypothetical protein [Nitrososphaerota archaeon]